MISAQEAYDIARPKYDQYLAFLEEKIRESAEQGKTSVLIRKEPYASWLYGTDKNDKEVEDVLKVLKDKGFKYRLHYQELQFVDIGLHIFWGKE